MFLLYEGAVREPRHGWSLLLVAWIGVLCLSLAGLDTTPGHAATTISKRVAASSDDAEEEGVDGGTLGPGGMYLTSGDIELVRDDEPPPTGDQKVGLRFTGILVPKGSVITDAYLTFRAISADSPNTNSGTTNLTIHGEAADNPVTFPTTTYDITNRTLTSASVAWSPGTWTTNTNVNSPTITSIVQEIVSRGGWASGNSMVIIITGTGSRSAASYDGDSARAALLTITYRKRRVIRLD